MNGQRGFTLIEAIVAMSVLTLGLIAAMQLTGQGLRASTAAMERAERAIVAERLLDLYDITGVPSDGVLDDGTPYAVLVYPVAFDDLGAELPEGLVRVDVFFGEAEVPFLSALRREPFDG